jgi:subtilisin family serine protease
VPPIEERRFVGNEVVLDLPSTVSAQSLETLAQRYHLSRVGSVSFGLTGHTLYRWRVDDGRPVADVIRDLQQEQDVSAAQPNFTFKLQDQARSVEAREGDPAQYAVAKLHLPEAHRLATGDHVLVAVIDSAVDTAQPELQGVVAGSFDAIGGGAAPQAHGTAMAGAIAAHGRLIGVAPRVALLAVRAFGDSAGSAEATTFNIIRGLDWAVAHGARVINMSFAGPQDPVLQDALARARQRGIILVAAAGNAGPKSPPLYPAADPNVIAVTATDANDKLFAQANRGSYIALAAPGVDVLVPAPKGGVQLTSGTSVAAAQVSGIVALLIERNHSLSPEQARSILTSSARHLGATPRDNDFGAGLANAWQAVKAVDAQAAEQVSPGPSSRR